METLLGGGNSQTLSFFASFLKRGLFYKRKEFAPLGANSFLYRADPFSEGDWCAGKKTGCYKNCLPCKNGGKSIRYIQALLQISVAKHSFQGQYTKSYAAAVMYYKIDKWYLSHHFDSLSCPPQLSCTHCQTSFNINYNICISPWK